MTKRLVITGGTLLPLREQKEAIPDATIVVEDGILVEIGRGKRYAGDDESQVIDARERIVMPGLVNAHTHLFQVLLRGLWDDLPLMPWLEQIYGVGHVLEPEDCYLGALLGSLESIESGVTTVCDHFFLNPTPEHATAGIQGMRQAGVRTVFVRAIMDTGKLPPACVKEEPSQALDQVRHLQGHYAEETKTRMLGFMTGPNTPPINSSSALVRATAEFAGKEELRISSHVAESRDIVQQCEREHGTGVVEYLDSLGMVNSSALLAHCVHISPKEIQILALRGASVAHNPVSNCILADGVAPVAAMKSAGVNVALGTDGAASNHAQDMFEVMKITSLLQRVQTGHPETIDPYDVLRMATSNGAKALGLDDVTGTVEVGKRADLILVNPFRHTHGVAMHNVYSHLVHTLKASDVECTIVDGNILLRDGALTYPNVARLKLDAQMQAEDLKSRISSKQGRKEPQPA